VHKIVYFDNTFHYMRAHLLDVKDRLLFSFRNLILHYIRCLEVRSINALNERHILFER